MALYGVTRATSNLSLSNDLITLVASSTKPLRVYLICANGQGTSSAANDIRVARSTSGTTPGGAITVGAFDPGAPAAGFSAYTTWSVQPTLGAVVTRLGVNANGDKDKFTALPGAEIQVAAGGQLSIRSETGTSSVSFSLIVEEI